MFYKIGHRGASGYLPENTLPSFAKAIKLAVDMIELDARICKSQEVVVIHNRNIQQANRKKVLIKNTNYSDLKNFDIPTLKDVLDLVDRRVKINIELKSLETAKPVVEIIKDYIDNKGWQLDDFLISSFNKNSLKKVQRYLPEVNKSLLINKLSSSASLIKRVPFVFSHYLKFAQEINAFSVNIHKNLINKRIVRLAHQKGFKIFAYTVNSPREIARLKELSVDGIFSDFPDRL